MKQTNVILLIIAAFIAINNAYQTFGTNYKIMYLSWIVVAAICFLFAVRTYFKKE